MSRDKNTLKGLTLQIKEFLQDELKLTLHPNKIYIKTIYSGLDFLDWVNSKDHRVLRAKTKRKMLKRIKACPKLETVASYLGLLKHGNTNKIKTKIVEQTL